MKQEKPKIILMETGEYPNHPARSDYFQNLFKQCQKELSDLQLDLVIQISIVNHNGNKPQNWHVKFKGEKGSLYEGKQIKGILKFPNNYPEKQPKFYFDKVNPYGNYKGSTKLGYPLHENIYGDGQFDHELLQQRNTSTKPYKILEGISFFFHNPVEDQKANLAFPSDESEKARKQLSDLFEDADF